MRQMSRGLRPTSSCPSSVIEPKIGGELAVDHVERGGLARTVGVDEREQLTGGQFEVDAIHRLNATKRFAQARIF